jgi:flagellar hook-length control protein FliK
MRTDLAQRHLSQFSQVTEVAVNVTTATRAAGQQQASDQQGRQRQQEHAAEDNGPGRGLAEAGNPSSTFSLNGRESYA